MSDFSPSLQNAAAAGIPTTRQPYLDGNAGVRQSLEAMALKMREGRVDPAVVGWAGGVLKDAGLDGRDGFPIRRQVSALLEALRSQVIYAPDAYGAEVVSSAAATLCLRPNLCLHRGDCFPSGTLLLREDYELVPIEKIKVGERIWGLDGWTTIKATAFKGNLAVDAIEMNNGSTMFLTGEHKVFVGRCKHDRTICPSCYPALRRERFERVSVADLQEGEVLLQPERIAFGSEEPDPGRMYIEGLYISDGWSEENRFAISGKDGCRKEAQKHEVKAICERLGIPTYWHKRYIRINDAAWANRLAQRGTRARFKHIETLNLNEAAAEALLRGVMADSTANTNGPGRTFSTTSRELMVQMRILQRMFGVSTGLKMLTPAQHGGVGTHNLWRLGVRATNGRTEKTLAVKSIDRAVRKVPCWDIQTEDHYVYLAEHDVTVSNCDDLAVALGSATLSLGIPTVIVKQNFGGENQEHVLIAFQDENQEWTYADPSTKLPVGRAPQGAVDEIWIDPMGPVGPIPEAGAEIVTLGSAIASSFSSEIHSPVERRMHFAGNHWWHHDASGVSVYVDDAWLSTGLSGIPSEVGVGTIFGAPTVNEMIDFASVVGAEMKDIGAVPTTCTGWPKDPVGYQAWLMDMQDTMAEFQTASDAALAKFNSTSKYLRDFTSAPEEMNALADVARQITDLDRRLRAATGGAGCSAPTYADVQQPQAIDWDLQGYQGADFAAKVVENAGKKIAGAAQPAGIAFGGLIVGAALAVAGLIVLDHMLPSRR
jgi:hypothetical protein